MLTDTEIAFLNARLDEDEAAAKAATDGPWYTNGSEIRGHSRTYAGGEPGILVVKHTWPQESAHITRQDPARTLREVEVWRRLLLDYQGAPLDAAYGGTERETGFRLALSAALKAKIATYPGNPVTGEPFPTLGNRAGKPSSVRERIDRPGS